MKRFFFVTILIAFVFSGTTQSLAGRLEKLAEKYSFTFEKLQSDTLFEEKYMLVVEQPLNHEEPEGETFYQMVILAHQDKKKPVVFVTEGYAAKYALNPKYVHELAYLLDANQVVVEHRYFGLSVPNEKVWEQLTIANAAADHHAVVEILKEIYRGKWINTGISKGGQTTMYHRYFYPEDVDISVPYVAPLNFSDEDKRVYYFLDTVGDPVCRQNVKAFQTEMLRNKATYLSAFEKLAAQNNLTYSMGLEKAYELTVLEYAFAFFQWGTIACADIPKKGKPAAMVEHLDQVAGISWISNEGIANLQPFFYQAMKEIGFYGYDISPFAEWVSFPGNPTFEFSLPEGIKPGFDPLPMSKIDYFIRHEAEKMIFIYGGADPWSSTAVDLTRNTRSFKVVKKDGSHLTRIKNLPEEQKQMVLDSLRIWLAE